MSGTEPSVGRVLERTENHALGVYGDVVIEYAFPGSADDPRHVTAIAEAVASASRRTRKLVPVMFVLAETSGSKPPSAAVRESIKKWARQCQPLASKLVVVMPGEGFGPAIHKAVLGTLITIFRPQVRVVVASTVPEGLAELLGSREQVASAQAFCERELAGGGGLVARQE